MTHFRQDATYGRGEALLGWYRAVEGVEDVLGGAASVSVERALKHFLLSRLLDEKQHMKIC